jgi:hypothetical protein
MAQVLGAVAVVVGVCTAAWPQDGVTASLQLDRARFHPSWNPLAFLQPLLSYRILYEVMF